MVYVSKDKHKNGTPIRRLRVIGSLAILHGPFVVGGGGRGRQGEEEGQVKREREKKSPRASLETPSRNLAINHRDFVPIRVQCVI